VNIDCDGRKLIVVGRILIVVGRKLKVGGKIELSAVPTGCRDAETRFKSAVKLPLRRNIFSPDNGPVSDK
jgi:hypothetical protein